MKWRLGLFHSLMVFCFVESAIAADLVPNLCSYQSFCERYGKGYHNEQGYRVRSRFESDFNWDQFKSDAQIKRIQEIFADAKRRLIRVLSGEAMLAQEVRDQLIARIDSVNLLIQGETSAESAYAAVFWPDSNEVLTVYSTAEMPKANLLNLFAHELSHAIDETALWYTMIREGSSVYQNDEDKNPSIGKPERKILSRPISSEEMSPITQILSLRFQIQPEQMSESTSDYFAARVSADYLSELPRADQEQAAFEGQMDLIISGCQHPEMIHNGRSTYPSYSTRVEKVYFGNYRIAKMAGCPQD